MVQKLSYKQNSIHKCKEILCGVPQEMKFLKEIGSTCKDKYFKFVGVKFDEILNWNYQLDGICAKLSSAIFALKNVKKIQPLNIRKFNKILIRIRYFSMGIINKQ